VDVQPKNRTEKVDAINGALGSYYSFIKRMDFMYREFQSESHNYRKGGKVERIRSKITTHGEYWLLPGGTRFGGLQTFGFS
jgi:hypothetical protein